MLYVVATPIGNLGDITMRALETLRTVDLIAAEDTRRTAILLHAHGISKPMVSANDHNMRGRIPQLLGMMQEGKKVALVSDAGTPGISDPGYLLIKAAIANSIPVIPLPGPTAAISALVCSGLPTDKFTFAGFLSKKEKKKREFLEAITHTTVVYESPYRIMKTLELMRTCIPQHRVCLAREITKKFEEFLRGTPDEILAAVGNRTLKGEIVLVIAPEE
jgi:16S rRNA (cytidine1402-2'-O)-methyltransferase